MNDYTRAYLLHAKRNLNLCVVVKGFDVEAELVKWNPSFIKATVQLLLPMTQQTLPQQLSQRA
jgi:hypothetical protein